MVISDLKYMYVSRLKIFPEIGSGYINIGPSKMMLLWVARYFGHMKQMVYGERESLTHSGYIHVAPAKFLKERVCSVGLLGSPWKPVQGLTTGGWVISLVGWLVVPCDTSQ